MVANRAQGAQRGLIVCKQVEGRASEIDRAVSLPQCQVFYALVMDFYGEPAPLRFLSAAFYHVDRRIDSIHLQPGSAEVEHGLAVSAANF